VCVCACVCVCVCVCVCERKSESESYEKKMSSIAALGSLTFTAVANDEFFSLLRPCLQAHSKSTQPLT
jgi:hypothetical protein